MLAFVKHFSGAAPAQLSAGDSHTCGRTGGNVAFCWGKSEFGQLGDGTQTDRSAPVRSSGHREE
jgi:alpha-tubulin suppressor-like RCC1 family protein